MKNEFVSMVSHELRTPLTSIRGSLGLARRRRAGDLPERAEQLLNIAQQSCERLTRLINDILDVERFESGSIPMEVGEHSRSRSGHGGGTSGGTGRLDSRIRLTGHRADGVVAADADRVLQALINLISNAVKFSNCRGRSDSGGGAPRRLRRIRHHRPRSRHPTGPAGQHLQPVRAGRLLRLQGEGRDAASGLAISRSIVEQLGGRIWARSDPVRGTVFTFTLPRFSRTGADGRRIDRTDPGLR